MKLLSVNFFLSVFIFLMPLVAMADTMPNPVADEIFSSVMSPYCAGRLLRDCPSGQAAELKDKMRQSLAEGKPKEAVLEDFYREYGESYRATPKGSGFGLFGWIAPGLFFILGGVLVYSWIGANRKAAISEAKINESLPRPIASDLSAEMKARIERELAN